MPSAGRQCPASSIPGGSGKGLGKQALLNFVSDFDIALDALVLFCFGGQATGEIADLQSQTGLGADGSKETQIGRGIRFLRLLRTQCHDAHQPAATGERQQQLRADAAERFLLGAIGIEKPAIGILEVEHGGGNGGGQMPHGRGIFGEFQGRVEMGAQFMSEAKSLHVAEQNDDARDVKHFGDAGRDGVDQGAGVSHGAGPLSEIAQYQFGVVGFAEKAAVEPLLDPITDSLSHRKEQDEHSDGQNGDDQ